MIRTSSLKTEYSPISKIGNTYKVCWDKQDIKDPIFAELTPEEKEREAAGEIIHRTVTGYKDTDYCSYMYKYIESPTIESIKSMILDWYDSQTDYKILTGYVWTVPKVGGEIEQVSVWLSSENQFNYKAAFDLAIQTNGQNLPIKFKFGVPDKPVYHTFTQLSELQDFYFGSVTFINNTLNEGWQKKDNIDWSVYEKALNNNE